VLAVAVVFGTTAGVAAAGEGHESEATPKSEEVGPWFEARKSVCLQKMDQAVVVLEMAKFRVGEMSRLHPEKKAAILEGIQKTIRALQGDWRERVSHAESWAELEEACLTRKFVKRFWLLYVPQIVFGGHAEALGYWSEVFENSADGIDGERGEKIAQHLAEARELLQHVQYKLASVSPSSCDDNEDAVKQKWANAQKYLYKALLELIEARQLIDGA
jgi:hypothetical protein